MPLTRRLILQKARRHLHQTVSAPTDCRQTVSGTISLPSRGTFHLSLTVLVRYRSPGSIQAYQVVLADSRQITGVRRYSGHAQQTRNFRLPDYHRLRCRFPTTSTSCEFSDCSTRRQTSPHAPTTPHTQPLPGI